MTTTLRGFTNCYGLIPVASEGDLAVFEFDERFYCVEVGDYQLFSVGPDRPDGGGRWFANGCNGSAIRYVARGRSRTAAIKMMHKYA